MSRQDYYHFLTQDELDALEAELQAGPQPMQRMGGPLGRWLVCYLRRG